MAERIPLVTRFNTHIGPTTAAGCKIWQGCKSRGYGYIENGCGKMVGAHRVAWEIVHGPVPAGMHVLHRCDVRACVNAEHLFLGTNRDNVNDRILKNRSAVLRGESNGMAKLTVAEIDEIRSRFAEGEFQADIATEFGVHQTAIGKIIRHETWAVGSLGANQQIPFGESNRVRGSRSPGAKLTDDDVREIRNLYATGNFSQAVLAAKFEIASSNVSVIISRKRWAHVL